VRTQDNPRRVRAIGEAAKMGLGMNDRPLCRSTRDHTGLLRQLRVRSRRIRRRAHVSVGHWHRCPFEPGYDVDVSGRHGLDFQFDTQNLSAWQPIPRSSTGSPTARYLPHGFAVRGRGQVPRDRTLSSPDAQDRCGGRGNGSRPC